MVSGRSATLASDRDRERGFETHAYHERSLRDASGLSVVACGKVPATGYWRLRS